ncbi:MAG: hypothetical protein IJV69_07165, partial [Kiritimatiellae bacterium]|nr:hypothetical protein [Kiritimatiellia bacterium]
ASATDYGGQWWGDLTLEPGKGYKLQIANATTVKYADATPVTASAAVLSVNGAPDWACRECQYNMVVYASVKDSAGNAFEAEGSLLAAFDANGVCQNVVTIGDAPRGKLYQLAPGSDSASGETFTLKLWDAATGQIYDIEQTVTFASDSTIGSIINPQVYTVVETEVKYPVVVKVIGEGSVAGEASYAAGEEVVLTATADEGNLFCGWSTTPVTMTAAYTFTMPEEAVTLTAYFAPADAVEAYVSGKELVTADEVDAKIQDYIVVNQLMSKDAAKQALLAADEVFTADEMKEMAFGAPVMEVKDDVIEIAISLQTAETLNAWEALALQGATLEIDATKGQVRVKVPKGNKSAAFYKFVVPTEQ